MGHTTMAYRAADDVAAPPGRRAAVKLATRRAIRLGAGVALGLTGIAVTGGSFGLFAAIGIPILAVGLSLISSEVNRDGPTRAAGPLVVATGERAVPASPAQRDHHRNAPTTPTPIVAKAA